MSAFTNTLVKPRLSVKSQTLAALAAVCGAVAVPQIFHAVGALSGHGTALGEIFLPMHLPIILVGLLAGPYAGAIAGLLGPLASFALTGMPTAVMLPFMMIELCAYGFMAGLLSESKMPDISKIFTVQLTGRLVRAAAVLIAVYALGNDKVNVASIWMSVRNGLPGLLIQWTLLPLLMYRVRGIKKHE